MNERIKDAVSGAAIGLGVGLLSDVPPSLMFTKWIEGTGIVLLTNTFYNDLQRSRGYAIENYQAAPYFMTGIFLGYCCANGTKTMAKYLF